MIHRLSIEQHQRRALWPPLRETASYLQNRAAGKPLCGRFGAGQSFDWDRHRLAPAATTRFNESLPHGLTTARYRARVRGCARRAPDVICARYAAREVRFVSVPWSCCVIMGSSSTEYVRPPIPRADHDRFWEPELLPPGDAAKLSSEQTRHFLEKGFIALDGIWPDDMIERASAEAAEYFPNPHEREEGDVGAELSWGNMHIAKDRRGRPWPGYIHTAPARSRIVAMPFFDLDDPARSPDLALNHIGLHPRLLNVVTQLMGRTDPAEIRSDQNVLRARYGPTDKSPPDLRGEAVGNQDMHVDYGNNSLVVPPRTPYPDSVAVLMYYADFEVAGGPTHFAPAHGVELTAYDPVKAPFNPPNQSQQAGRCPDLLRRLYEEERPVRYRRGVAALYRCAGPTTTSICCAHSRTAMLNHVLAGSMHGTAGRRPIVTKFA